MNCLSNYGCGDNKEVSYAVQELCRLCMEEHAYGSDPDTVLKVVLEGLAARGSAAEAISNGAERTLAFVTAKRVTKALHGLPVIWESDFPIKLWVWKLLGDEELANLEDPDGSTEEKVWDQYLRKETFEERIEIVGTLQCLDTEGNYVEWEIFVTIMEMLGKILREEESKLELLRTDLMNRRRLVKILTSRTV